MRPDTTEAVWLDSERECSLPELSELSGLPQQVLRDLVDYGALAPTDPGAAHWTFSARVVIAARTAGRLRGDLELEPQALALALTLIERIRDLEAQVRGLRAQLPREPD